MAMADTWLENSGRAFQIQRRRHRFHASEKNLFFANVILHKNEHCEKCLGDMRRDGERWVQAGRGNISGWDVEIFKCIKCGHLHEIFNSRD